MNDKAIHLLRHAQVLVDNAQKLQWPAFRGYWEMAESDLEDAVKEIESSNGRNSRELLGPMEFLLSARCWAGHLAEAEETARRLIELTLLHETERSDRLARICEHLAHAHERYANHASAQFWLRRKRLMQERGHAFPL